MWVYKNSLCSCSGFFNLVTLARLCWEHGEITSHRSKNSQSFMQIPAHSWVSNLSDLHIFGQWAENQTSTRRHFRKQNTIVPFVKQWSDSVDTEIQLHPHTVHTQGDYAISVTHPPSLWQQSCSHTSVILAVPAWCCKQWQCYQKEACGEREGMNEVEKHRLSMRFLKTLLVSQLDGSAASVLLARTC